MSLSLCFFLIMIVYSLEQRMFECLKGVPLTFKDDLRVVQNCFMGVQGSFIEVSSMFQEGFKEVSMLFH